MRAREKTDRAGVLTIDLTPELKKAAAELARLQHRTVTGLVRELITRELRTYPQHLQRKFLPDDELAA